MASVLVLSMAMGALPVWSGQGPEAAGDAGDGTTAAVTSPEERVIREIYRAHEEAINRSGSYVEIELSGFRAVGPDQFAKVLWRDAWSPQGLERIQISRTRVVASDGKATGVSYLTRLVRLKQGNDPTHGLPLTLADGVRIWAEQEENAGRSVQAITTFEVTSRIELEVLRYRAFVTWLRLPGREDSGEYLVSDPVMDFVPAILTETEPIRPEVQLYRQLGEREEVLRRHVEDQTMAPETACVVESKDYEYPVVYLEPDTTGHASGNHAASAGATWTCACDSACTSRATVSLTNRSCTDTGQISGVSATHEKRVAEQAGSGAIVNASSEGASADAVFGCFIQQCVGMGGCGYSITLGGGTPVSVQFNGSNLVYSGTIPFNVRCGGCNLQQPVAARGRAQGRGPFQMSMEPISGPGGGGMTLGTSCFTACGPIVSSSAWACQPAQPPCFISHCEVIC